MNGASILIGWISNSVHLLGSAETRRLLIEPVVNIQLAIARFVITHDQDTRAQVYLSRTTCLEPLLLSMSTQLNPLFDYFVENPFILALLLIQETETKYTFKITFVA